MTIIILTIFAVLMVGIGIFIFIMNSEANTFEELLVYKAEAIIFIIVGIFVLLLALLFKLNPFW
jgi:hypothetical protein